MYNKIPYIYINLIHTYIMNEQKKKKIKVKVLRITRLVTTSFKKINITKYFENLTIGLHILYALNTYDKFCAN